MLIEDMTLNDWLVRIVGVLVVLALLAYFERKGRRENRAPVVLPQLDGDTEREIHRLLRERRKVEAVKLYREKTGLGLKPSKDAVEMIEKSLSLHSG